VLQAQAQAEAQAEAEAQAQAQAQAQAEAQAEAQALLDAKHALDPLYASHFGFNIDSSLVSVAKWYRAFLTIKYS